MILYQVVHRSQKGFGNRTKGPTLRDTHTHYSTLILFTASCSESATIKDSGGKHFSVRAGTDGSSWLQDLRVNQSILEYVKEEHQSVSVLYDCGLCKTKQLYVCRRTCSSRKQMRGMSLELLHASKTISPSPYLVATS